MRRSVEVQYLRPDEILASREKHGIIYLPLAPLEWHGPHLPLGVDPLRAHLAAVHLARRLGGLVMPTLFIGTERERSPQMLRNIGFRGDEYIVGMDFPACVLKSLYFKEEVFAVLLREQLDLLIHAWEFPKIVIVNGHGGENHLQVLERLRKECNAAGQAKVIVVMPMLNYPNGGWGHATREETETLMPFHPDSVDLSQLPPKGQPIENVRWAVVDDASFRGRAKKPVVCREEDPRLASARRGKQVFGRTLDQLTELLRRELS